ncbi:lactate dehydrogenase/glycoside hydrolase [Stachybotrys elegans]|uniref:Lactate dehydrogenase/glycoside hydrolase n=1 Tax=Stachybotrys elegans TaxID=80388 RepID=A0A8K0SDP4_9HYPO|nr:lactate dehydrogenase/glycoside hydrolase [Stachybotrys elegans]
MSAARVAIVGVGHVGGAAAFALTLASFADQLLLVDVDPKKRDAQVRDVSDAAYSSNSRTLVRAGTCREASQCDIIVITVGSKFALGQTTIELTYRNISIVQSLIKEMAPFQKDAVLIVVSNPVDLLATLVQQASGLPASQVIGSGTFLDSVRLRGMVTEYTKVPAKSIHLFVLGVHGEHQVVAWSRATIGSMPIDEALAKDNSVLDHQQLEKDYKNQSKEIIQAKGSMPFGIGTIITCLCSSIIFNKRNVLPVSHFQPRFGCYLSMPAAVGRRGIAQSFPILLDKDEDNRLSDSAKALKSNLDRISKF